MIEETKTSKQAKIKSPNPANKKSQVEAFEHQLCQLSNIVHDSKSIIQQSGSRVSPTKADAQKSDDTQKNNIETVF
jgi:hypothetical protein